MILPLLRRRALNAVGRNSVEAAYRTRP